MKDAVILTIANLTKTYGGVHAVDDVSLSISSHECVGLLGPNGAGKTTLMTLIGGGELPTSGVCTWEGEDITRIPAFERCRRGIARTFQITRPFLELTVGENIMVGALANGLSRREALETARDSAELVGLSHKFGAPGSGLSTGQRKRLEVARALATRPRLLLLDEPLAGVDQPSWAMIQATIEKTRERGIAVVLVEHNLSFVKDVTERSVAMVEGRVIVDGATEAVLEDPRFQAAQMGGVA